MKNQETRKSPITYLTFERPAFSDKVMMSTMEQGKAVKAWQAAVEQLERDMPRASFDVHLKETILQEYQDGRFIVGVSELYNRDWLENRLTSTLVRFLTGAMNRTVEVCFVVSAPLEASEPGNYLENPSVELVHERLEDFPKQLAGKVLSDLDWSTYPAKTKEAIQRFIHHLDHYLERGMGLWLYGPAGTGKTHLAVGIARLAAETGYRVGLVNMPAWLEELRSTFDGRSPFQGENPNLGCLRRLERKHSLKNTLLILDDLTGYATPWARDMIYQVVNRRYEAGASTFITSNLTPNDLAGVQSAGTLSRLAGMCMLVPVETGDYRQAIKQNTIKEIHSL